MNNIRRWQVIISMLVVEAIQKAKDWEKKT
jgi:hypothetical protein